MNSRSTVLFIAHVVRMATNNDEFDLVMGWMSKLRNTLIIILRVHCDSDADFVS